MTSNRATRLHGQFKEYRPKQLN